MYQGQYNRGKPFWRFYKVTGAAGDQAIPTYLRILNGNPPTGWRETSQ